MSLLLSLILLIFRPNSNINSLCFSYRYLANLTLESLQEMFTGAKDIMDWLGTCAALVASQVRIRGIVFLIR